MGMRKGQHMLEKEKFKLGGGEARPLEEGISRGTILVILESTKQSAREVPTRRKRPQAERRN